MPLAFPFALADFIDLLAIAPSPLPRLTEAVSQSRTRGGTVIRTEVGSRLWTGRINVSPGSRTEADQMMSRIEPLLEAGGSFVWTRRAVIAPQADPTGTILGAATPTIASVSADNRDLAINGLPANYQLRRGDMLSFSYGSTPTRFALHRVVTTRTANGSGQMTALSVVPLIRPGAAAGSAITLLRPTCKAVILPDSLEAPLDASGYVTEFGFDWVQALS